MSAAQPPQDPALQLQAIQDKLKQRRQQLLHTLELQAMGTKAQFDQAKLQVDMEAKQHEGQIKGAIDQVRAKQREQAKASAGKEKQQKAADQQATAPVLGTAQQLDGTRPDAETMPGVGPNEMSVVQPPTGQSPYGSLTPYITSRQQVESVQERPWGGVPVTTTSTVSRPNVMSAYQAAKIQFANQQERQKLRTTYIDELAGAVHYLGPDDPRVRGELEKLNAGERLMLMHSLGKVASVAEKGSEENPLEVLKGGQFVRVPREEALGMPTGALEKRAAGATRVNVGPFDLTPATKNTVQEQMVGSLASVEQLRAIEETYKPEFFTTQEQVRQWLIANGKRLGMKQEDAAKVESANYDQLMALVSTYSADELHRVAGAALTPFEFKMNEPRLPMPGDNPDTLITKVRTARRMSELAYVRSRKLLAHGFTDMDSALADHPEYVFSGGTATKASRGELTLMAEMGEEQQRIADRLKEMNPKLSDKAAAQQAMEEVRRTYGLR